MNVFISIVISGSVMILFTAVFRAFFVKRLRKRTFLILWAVIMLRMLIPVSFPILPSWLDSHPLFGTQETTEKITNSLPEFTPSEPLISPVPSIPIENYTPQEPVSLDRDISDISDISAAVPAASSDNISPVTVLTVIWIVGIALFALYFVITYVRCMKFFSESLPVKGFEYTNKWLAEHRLLSRKITVRSFDGIVSPLTYGIFSPVILLPGNYYELSGDELNIILTHEYIHIKRFDTAFKLVLTAVLCIYWFDPFVWLMYILANKDIELACDEAVLLQIGDSGRKLYANTLVRMEELKSDSAPTVTNFSGKN